MMRSSIRHRAWPICCHATRHGAVTRHFSHRLFTSTTSQPIPSPSPAPSSLSSPLTLNDYLRMILTANVYDVALETPLQVAPNLSARLGHAVYLKREDLQPCFSFKLRGSYNKMANLSAEQRARGVLTCSAGNHAQGVAMAAQRMRIQATVIMPVFTPLIKVNAVRRLGAEVILFGEDFNQASIECRRLAELDGRQLIHPFDDPLVIAGQGTIGVEILRQFSSARAHALARGIASDANIHTVFVCVGGGGLISGIGLYLKAIMPTIRIVGVETEDACALKQSLDAKQRIELKDVGLFAEGAAVRAVGIENFRVCQQVVDDMILVTNDEICAAIKDCFEDTRSVLETAGALGLAGAKKYIAANPLPAGQSFVVISSGANMQFSRLRFVAERADLGEQKEALLAVTIPEQPGSFLKLIRKITPRNVTEFSYRYDDAQEAHIYLSFEVKSRAEVEQVCRDIDKQPGMKAIDISANDLAKDHSRHLAGGRSPSVTNERVFAFEFPDRPFALLRFLETLGASAAFNVSLFHYRNFASDTGRVLVGIQVLPEQTDAIESFLKQLNYTYREETNNVVYQKFLR